VVMLVDGHCEGGGEAGGGTSVRDIVAPLTECR
jgi:hypothetical protein